jgi:hypothetical protein
VVPDSKIVSKDYRTQFEISPLDFKERKRRDISSSEAEEKIIHMRPVDFYSNLNRISLHRLKLQGVKLPQQSEGAKITRDYILSKALRKSADLNR